MPRNGSGSYTAPSNTWNPATPDTAILSDDWNSTLSDMSTALSQSLASDGQTTASTVIPFAQGLSVSSGLLTSPSIAVIGDADTGFYFPAANQATLVCGGVAVMQATASVITFPVGVVFSGSPSITGNLTLTGNLTVDGNTTIGNASGDTLTVAATGTWAAAQTFNGTATFTSTVTVPDASFSNAKLANMAQDRIKGRVSSGSGVTEDLTGAQVTPLLSAMTGATQSVAGTKGLAPQPAAGDQDKVLAGDGTYRAGLGRSFGCIITTTNVVGSQPTLSGTVNVASVSLISSAVAGVNDCTITFTNALPSTSFAVIAMSNGTPTSTSDIAYGAKTTTTVELRWPTGGVTEISVSGFA